MSKILIIPDIHNKIEIANEILCNEPHEQVVFLGDYFDDFGDNEFVIANVALFVKKQLENPNATLILGNHDVSYFHCGNPGSGCTGFSHQKNRVIQKILPKNKRKRFSFYHEIKVKEKTILLSHAGISQGLVSIVPSISQKAFSRFLSYHKQDAMEILSKSLGIDSLFLQVGRVRGGISKEGGILWNDYTHEHRPLFGLRGVIQIFGHTPLSIPSLAYRTGVGFDRKMPVDKIETLNFKGGGASFCIDTHLRDYVVIDTQEGSLSFKQVKGFTEINKFHI